MDGVGGEINQIKSWFLIVKLISPGQTRIQRAEVRMRRLQRNPRRTKTIAKEHHALTHTKWGDTSHATIHQNLPKEAYRTPAGLERHVRNCP